MKLGPYELGAVHVTDVLKGLRRLPDECVQCVITSPPYWGLRDYGVEGQLGLERTPAEYLKVMVRIFEQVWRVLRSDGTLWLNTDGEIGAMLKQIYAGPAVMQGE